jgi:uncharacterized protein YkwD
LISIRSARLGSRVPIATLAAQMRRHPAITRAIAAGLVLALAGGISVGGAAQAGLTAVVPAPPSILPLNVGIGIGTRDPVTLSFAQAMDPASVEVALTVTPAHPFRAAWSHDGRSLHLVPVSPWQTDARYALTVSSTARTASGALLGGPVRFSFTTQTAPRVREFSVTTAPAPPVPAAAMDPAADDPPGAAVAVASGVSSGTAIRITFNSAVDRGEVEAGFLLSPAVPGVFTWAGTTMTFSPIERLASDARYAVSVAGVHDLAGNPLAGDTSFSFTTRAASQLLRSTPAAGATRVTARELVLWFSQSVDAGTVGQALRVRDRTSGKTLTGSLVWNAAGTQLRFTPTRAFAAGHRIDISLADGAVDADGNAVTVSLSFTTRASAHATPSATGPQAPSAAITYALNQLNAARAAHGLKALVYDTAIERVALAHAWDQVIYNYFSHTGRDGSSHEQRLRAAGLKFGWNGENQCMNSDTGRTTTQTLDWCQAQFMSEPYPGVANHIGNILGTHYTRVGIGIAIRGAKVIIVWDFTD